MTKTPRRRRSRRPPDDPPVLRFSPYAWAKLQWFCHAGDTEIGGFGLTDPDDPLLVIDLLTLKQEVSAASVCFDDEAVADLFDQQVDAGIKPDRFARVWLHTHPGDSPSPSGTDEQTFDRVFRGCDWAVMFILAKGGQAYARLRFNAGPGGELELDTEVDYGVPFNGSDVEGWRADYEQHIHAVSPPTPAWDGFDLDEDDDPMDRAYLLAAFDAYSEASETGVWPDGLDDELAPELEEV